MKQFAEFASLAEAQAHTISTYLDIDGGWLGQYFTVLGITSTIKTAQANPTEIELVPGHRTTLGQLATFLVDTVKEGKNFGADPSTNNGEYFRLIMAELVSRGLLTQPQFDFIFTSHTIETKPYKDKTQADWDEAKDVGQTIPLPTNNTQHKVTLAITTQPRQATRITIQQRFGNDVNDLTEWHDVGSVTVLYKQRTYSSGMVPPAPAAIRELRAVSPLTLGLSNV